MSSTSLAESSIRGLLPAVAGPPTLSVVDDADDLARGQRITQAYKRRKMNRAQFAKKLGVLYHQVIRWEKGAEPGLGVLVRMADICNVSVDDLVRGPLPPEQTELERDGGVLRIVQEFVDSLDRDELLEFEKFDGREWSEGLAFSIDAMKKLGIEPDASTIRDLWRSRRRQLRAAEATTYQPTIPAGKMALPQSAPKSRLGRGKRG